MFAGFAVIVGYARYVKYLTEKKADKNRAPSWWEITMTRKQKFLAVATCFVFWYFEIKYLEFPGEPMQEKRLINRCERNEYIWKGQMDYDPHGVTITCNRAYWLPQYQQRIECLEGGEWETPLPTFCVGKINTLLGIMYLGIIVFCVTVTLYYRIKDMIRYKRPLLYVNWFEPREMYLEYEANDIRKYIATYTDIFCTVALWTHITLACYCYLQWGFDTADETHGKNDLWGDIRICMPILHQLGAVSRILNLLAFRNITPTGIFYLLVMSAGPGMTDVIQNHFVLYNVGNYEAFSMQIDVARLLAFPPLIVQMLWTFEEHPIQSILSSTMGFLGPAAAKRCGSALMGTHRTTWPAHGVSHVAFELAFYDVTEWNKPSYWITGASDEL